MVDGRALRQAAGVPIGRQCTPRPLYLREPRQNRCAGEYPGGCRRTGRVLIPVTNLGPATLADKQGMADNLEWEFLAVPDGYGIWCECRGSRGSPNVADGKAGVECIFDTRTERLLRLGCFGHARMLVVLDDGPSTRKDADPV
jgi:hypothetical protein